MASSAASDMVWGSWLGTVIAVAAAVLGVAAIVVGAHAAVRRLGRRSAWAGELEARVRIPLVWLALVIALWIAMAATAPGRQDWWPVPTRIFLIATIVSGAWMLSVLVSFGIERLLQHESRRQEAGPQARRRQTQLTILNRLAIVLIAVIALGMVLFTFPEVQAVGMSILASAGIVSVVAGLAAQSTLGNLIAGIQIAFSDAIRVGDVVVIQGEWGRIGEINLSYVVVYIWDERRLILPCTYFTSQPFESWTRRSDKILGTVLMDLDWRVPVAAVRERFTAILEDAPEWDRRSANVMVTGAEGGHVTLRFVVSAANSADQWALRCRVREEIVTWLQREHPEALPVSRVRVEPFADEPDAPVKSTQ